MATTARKTVPAAEQQELPQHASIAAALAAFQGEMPTVAKTKTARVTMKGGGSYSYTYADLADVTQAAMPVLARHGLAFVAVPQRTEQGYRLLGQLLHTSGGAIEGELPLYVGSPQETGSALTYARRYLLGCLTGIVTDDDEDGAAAQQSVQRQQSEQRQSARQGAQNRAQGSRRAQTTREHSEPANAAQTSADAPQGDHADAARLWREVLDVAEGFEPGEARAELLRAVHRRAAHAHVLDVPVPLPRGWRSESDPSALPLRDLIRGAVNAASEHGEPRDDEQQSSDDPWGSDAPGANVERI